jgi:hypothetical protein
MSLIFMMVLRRVVLVGFKFWFPGVLLSGHSRRTVFNEYSLGTETDKHRQL